MAFGPFCQTVFQKCCTRLHPSQQTADKRPRSPGHQRDDVVEPPLRLVGEHRTAFMFEFALLLFFLDFPINLLTDYRCPCDTSISGG